MKTRKTSELIDVFWCFQNTSNLLHLDVSGNELREAGGEVIGEALLDNKTLESLDLSWNHLRRDGACFVADGLAVIYVFVFFHIYLAVNSSPRLHLQRLKSNYPLKRFEPRTFGLNIYPYISIHCQFKISKLLTNMCI